MVPSPSPSGSPLKRRPHIRRSSFVPRFSSSASPEPARRTLLITPHLTLSSILPFVLRRPNTQLTILVLALPPHAPPTPAERRAAREAVRLRRASGVRIVTVPLGLGARRELRGALERVQGQGLDGWESAVLVLDELPWQADGILPLPSLLDVLAPSLALPASLTVFSPAWLSELPLLALRAHDRLLPLLPRAGGSFPPDALAQPHTLRSAPRTPSTRLSTSSRKRRSVVLTSSEDLHVLARQIPTPPPAVPGAGRPLRVHSVRARRVRGRSERGRGVTVRSRKASMIGWGERGTAECVGRQGWGGRWGVGGCCRRAQEGWDCANCGRGGDAGDERFGCILEI